MNNKGWFNLMFGILIFGVIVLVLMFGIIFMKEAGDQYLGTPLKNIGENVLDNSNAPHEFSNTLDSIETNYNDLLLPYDIIFLIFWIFFSGSVFILAYQTSRLGIYHWVGMLFIGSLFFLLITGFVAQFTDWFITNFYNVLFSDVTLNTPIMDFYFSNMALINYLTFAICLFMNIIRKINIDDGRVEE